MRQAFAGLAAGRLADGHEGLRQPEGFARPEVTAQLTRSDTGTSPTRRYPFALSTLRVGYRALHPSVMSVCRSARRAVLAQMTDLHTDRTGYVRGETVTVTTRGTESEQPRHRQLLRSTGSSSPTVPEDTVKQRISRSCSHSRSADQQVRRFSCRGRRLKPPLSHQGPTSWSASSRTSRPEGVRVYVDNARAYYFQVSQPPAGRGEHRATTTKQGTVTEIHRVDVESGQQSAADLYWVVSYLDQAPLSTPTTGRDRTSPRYTGLNHAVVVDADGFAVKTGSDIVRKAVFTAQAFRVFNPYVSFVGLAGAGRRSGRYSRHSRRTRIPSSGRT